MDSNGIFTSSKTRKTPGIVVQQSGHHVPWKRTAFKLSYFFKYSIASLLNSYQSQRSYP